MCGRFMVNGEYSPQGQLGVKAQDFKLASQADLSPGQRVDVLVVSGTGVEGGNHTAAGEADGIAWATMVWGIKPDWSTRMLINARCETAWQKTTFRKAIREQRCLVPFRGWYEWRQEGTSKQRYLFCPADGGWLLMAGLWLGASADQGRLITLTTAADLQCASYHGRMPLLLNKNQARAWLRPGEVQASQFAAAHAAEGASSATPPIELDIRPYQPPQMGLETGQGELF